MGINSQEVSYGFGQLGSAFSTGAVIKPPKGMVIVAVQSLNNTTTFSTLTEARDGNIECVGIVASGSDHAHSETNPTDDHGSGGVALTGNVGIGTTLYGRWTAAGASNPFLAYFGH